MLLFRSNYFLFFFCFPENKTNSMVRLVEPNVQHNYRKVPPVDMILSQFHPSHYTTYLSKFHLNVILSPSRWYQQFPVIPSTKCLYPRYVNWIV
jgi:hypothetical protein